MRVFITGATGFIGSAVVKELLAAGHDVLGLARSDSGADKLLAAGARVHRGSLEDLESLRTGAATADAVIHLAFNIDFARFAENAEHERRAIDAIGGVLEGSNRKFVITSVLGLLAPGRLAVESDVAPTDPRIPRNPDAAAAAVADRGVNVSVVRLSQIHNTEKQGLCSFAIRIAREKGVSAYAGDGLNRWPAAHVLAAARLYRLALERGEPGARYHAVAEEGIAVRQIAEAIGQGLNLPAVSLSREEATAHFGWLAPFAITDMPASSAWTRQQLGWTPAGSGLLEDLRNMRW